MKATEQYFPVVLFIILYKVVLTFEPVDEILNCDHSNEATEQYFPVVLFIILYKVVLTFKPVDEIPACDHLMKIIGHSIDIKLQYLDQCGQRSKMRIMLY